MVFSFASDNAKHQPSRLDQLLLRLEQTISQGVLKAPMSRFKATTAYWTMYIPSITFDIGSTLMDLDQLDNIQKPLIHAILPKMRYSSKTCRYVMVFGPRNYLGIGAKDLVTERGVQQTLMFVKNIRSDQDLSKLLCIGLKWFQLHASIARPILECPYQSPILGSWMVPDPSKISVFHQC